jgi:hypothetical protein
LGKFSRRVRGVGIRRKCRRRPGRPPSKIRTKSARYFFSSVVTDGGGAVAVGAAGVAAGGCGGGSPRMPSLNSRTPCPSPFIISGIFLPPKRTSTTTARIKRCIGLSNIETYLSHPANRARHPKTTTSGACRHITLLHGIARQTPQTLRLRLQYNTLVPGPPRHVLAVQMLEQWNRVFAADPCKLFECRNRQVIAFLLAVFR